MGTLATTTRYLKQVLGIFTEQAPIVTSAGAGDAEKMIALDATGKLDNSFMPVGIGADTYSVTTSEALAAGDWVNLHNSTGLKARKADATAAGKEVHGFVLAAAISGASATVYFEGTNTQVTGMTPGSNIFLTTTPGIGSATCPSTAGNIAQKIGIALSATEVSFEPQSPITLA